MTAIAVSFDSAQRRFVIATDGRVASQTLPMHVLTDSQQKIFFLENKLFTVAYSMTGLSRSSSFDMLAEIRGQMETLAARRFADGYAFVHKLGFNMTKVLERAVKENRITNLLDCDDLAPEEKGRMLRILPLGFYGGMPFWAIASLYYDRANHRFSVRYQDFELDQFRTAPLGSDKIAAMIYEGGPVDPRLQRYRDAADIAPDALARTAVFVQACSDPVAVEIDPWCRTIGGHLHAAELTETGFRWLIPPVAART
jgi:hypothetical protein